MAKFILKWRYIKAGSAKYHQSIVKYIATREGVEKCDESWKYQNATVEQKRLIEKMTHDFPDSLQSFEYQDYISSPTKSSASEFISRAIEENLDLIGKKENYVGYIALRPRVEKQGSHGLFTQTDGEINLDEVSKTVASHSGAVWTTIMSIRCEDAERLVYNNAKAWRDMLRSNSNKLAKAMGIPLTDLRWYAAFHNDGSHPHIHLISYSVGKEPFMTEQALKNFKSDFAHEIFKNDFYHTYQDQTVYRDSIRRRSREKMSDIAREINDGAYENETVKLMLCELKDELKNYTGKKVYGYMPKKIKNLVDGIVDEISKDERISELYNLWYEQRENIVRTYQETVPQRLPMSKNKEFKVIKNAVIQEAFNLLNNRITFEDDIIESDAILGDEETAHNPWSDPEDMHYQYLRGKRYLDIDSKEYNPEEAILWLKLSAEQGYVWAQYQLGKMYLYGQGVDKDYETALRLLTSSAEQGNDYAKQILHNYNSHSKGSSAAVLSSLRLLAYLSRIIKDEADKRDKSGRILDRKLMRKIEEKKMAQGQKMG